MSKEYEGQDPLAIAQQAERDLNSHSAIHGHNAGQSTTDSGVDTTVENKFPGSEVKVGSTGRGDNREIPVEEGGDLNKATGQPTKARDFEGVGGPETKQAQYEEANPGNEEVGSNVRQGNETIRP